MKALVLSGGNVKGCYQAGALKKLWERGYRPDAIYGTSVGAVNTFGLLYGDPNKLCDFWLQLKSKNQIIKREPLWRIFVDGFIQYNMKPLLEQLNEYAQDLPAPALRGVVTYVDLFSGCLCYSESRTASKQEFMEYVVASATEPPIVKPLYNRFYDGGLRDQTPLKKAIDDGATEIFVILTNPYPSKPEVWQPKKPYVLYNLLRAVDIISNEVYINDIERCLAYNGVPGKRQIMLKFISPNIELKGGFDVDPDLIRRGLQAGYEDADKFFDESK